jgi:DNA invertase Pin-like site-specific DNA recombinase
MHHRQDDRWLIRAHAGAQREGIARAKQASKYRGRKPTVAPQTATIRAAQAAGERPGAIARRLGIARSSVYRMLAPAG